MDITGCEAELHIRTDANNLVTTASTTHLPEQKETIHMINQLRTEASSAQMEDLAHVVTGDCLSDALTKNSIKPDVLIEAVQTGILPNCDNNPPFRKPMANRHKAYHQSLVPWAVLNLRKPHKIKTLLGTWVKEEVTSFITWLSTE